MPTPDELRGSLAQGRDAFRAALDAVHDRWEVRPEGAAEGEDAWSPRQVAEHAIPLVVQFASAVCTSCGYPGLEVARVPYATAQEAIAAFEVAAAQADGRLKYVTEKDLAMPHERMGNVEAIMALSARHLSDHAAQLLRS